MSNVKQKIIEEAINLILKKGVKASSVNEILKNSQAGKGQFYHYFDSKEALVKEIIHYYGCQVLDYHMQSLARVTTLKEYLDWVKSSFHVAEMEEKKIGGCLLGTIMNEVGHMRQEEVRNEIISVFEHWKRLIANKILELKQAGYLIHETPVEEMAEILLTIFEGSALFSKIYLDTAFVKRGLKHYCLFLQNYISPQHRVLPDD